MDALSENRMEQIKKESGYQALVDLPIYKRFCAADSPFSEDGGNIVLWFEDHVKILQINDGDSGEKLGYDCLSDTWFYEKWKTDYYLKTWKQGSHCWGENELKEKASRTKENWSWDSEEENYEHFHLEDANDYGSKSGRKNGISWKEIWHKKPYNSALEKYWISDTAKWGEKKGKIHEKSWELKWKQEGELFEETSWNKENDNEWGHVKGKNPEKEWYEYWTSNAIKKTNDKWWIEGTKKFGIKTINEGLSNFCEEWLEDGPSKRSTKSYDDGYGHKSKITEGFGEDYKYTEEYTHNVEIDEHITTKKGYNLYSKWNSYVYQIGKVFKVHNKGEDLNGSWEEVWEEDGSKKKAWKSGKSDLWGSWEEEWTEDGDVKSCKKSGCKGETWVEQWNEEPNKKFCRKEQCREGNLYIQEWEEIIVEDQKHHFGKFLENGVIVKEWDDFIPLSLD